MMEHRGAVSTIHRLRLHIVTHARRTAAVVVVSASRRPNGGMSGTVAPTVGFTAGINGHTWVTALRPNRLRHGEGA